jgi:hypothetical protein
MRGAHKQLLGSVQSKAFPMLVRHGRKIALSALFMAAVVLSVLFVSNLHDRSRLALQQRRIPWPQRVVQDKRAQADSLMRRTLGSVKSVLDSLSPHQAIGASSSHGNSASSSAGNHQDSEHSHDIKSRSMEGSSSHGDSASLSAGNHKSSEQSHDIQTRTPLRYPSPPAIIFRQDRGAFVESYSPPWNVYLLWSPSMQNMREYSETSMTSRLFCPCFFLIQASIYSLSRLTTTHRLVANLFDAHYEWARAQKLARSTLTKTIFSPEDSTVPSSLTTWPTLAAVSSWPLRLRTASTFTVPRIRQRPGYSRCIIRHSAAFRGSISHLSITADSRLRRQRQQHRRHWWHNVPDFSKSQFFDSGFCFLDFMIP